MCYTYVFNDVGKFGLYWMKLLPVMVLVLPRYMDMLGCYDIGYAGHKR